MKACIETTPVGEDADERSVTKTDIDIRSEFTSLVRMFKASLTLEAKTYELNSEQRHTSAPYVQGRNLDTNAKIGPGLTYTPARLSVHLSLTLNSGIHAGVMCSA